MLKTGDRDGGDGSVLTGGVGVGTGFSAVGAGIFSVMLLLAPCSAGGASDSASDIGSSTISASTFRVESPGIILTSVDINSSGEAGLASLKGSVVSSSSSKHQLVHTDCNLCSGSVGLILPDDGNVSGAFA